MELVGQEEFHIIYKNVYDAQTLDRNTTMHSLSLDEKLKIHKGGRAGGAIVGHEGSRNYNHFCSLALYSCCYILGWEWEVLYLSMNSGYFTYALIFTCVKNNYSII